MFEAWKEVLRRSVSAAARDVRLASVSSPPLFPLWNPAASLSERTPDRAPRSPSFSIFTAQRRFVLPSLSTSLMPRKQSVCNRSNLNSTANHCLMESLDLGCEAADSGKTLTRCANIALCRFYFSWCRTHKRASSRASSICRGVNVALSAKSPTSLRKSVGDMPAASVNLKTLRRCH